MTDVRTHPADPWTIELDAPLPARLHAGDGTVMLVGGVLLATGGVSSGEIEFAGRSTPLLARGMPRRDGVELRRDMAEHEAYRGGFWAIVPVPSVERPTVEAVRLRARGARGERLTRTLGFVRVFPGVGVTYRAARPEGGRHVEVCMATFDPDTELFDRQIASLRAQTHTSWSCVISDDASDRGRLAHVRSVVAGDPRFRLLEHERRVGFYHNFERALRAASPQADFVALADQDDVWAPEKLAVLLEPFDERGVQLAFGDMRAVDRDGRELAAGFWTTRSNNTKDLGRLLTSNTVTGAAALFRRELLDVALPFPAGLRLSFHDHWLAVCALTVGRISYVDRVLQDYVQHQGQVLGQALDPGPGVAPPERPRARTGTAHRWATFAGRRSSEARRRAWSQGEDAYVLRTFPRQWLGTVLLLRADRRGAAVPRTAHRVLRRAARGDAGAAGLLATAGRALSELRGRDVTLGYHGEEFRGALWRRAVRLRARLLRPEAADVAMVHVRARIDAPPWSD